jgi:hypothetical protein
LGGRHPRVATLKLWMFFAGWAILHGHAALGIGVLIASV